MKAFFFLRLVLSSIAASAVLTFPPWAHAQTGADTGVDGANIRDSGGKRLRLYDDPTRKGSNLISGKCVIVKSESNPIEGPCVNTLLNLIDAKGAQVSETRTSLKGHFAFSVDDMNAKYRVVNSSASYEPMGGQKEVRAGDRVVLRLRIK